jgi:hypothetical protein
VPRRSGSPHGVIGGVNCASAVTHIEQVITLIRKLLRPSIRSRLAIDARMIAAPLEAHCRDLCLPAAAFSLERRVVFETNSQV